MTVMPEFRLIRAESVADAVEARRSHPGSRLLAGGTDLINRMRRGLGATEVLVDITGIPRCQEIEIDADAIRIGAAVTLTRLEEDPRIRQLFPAIAHAAATVAGPTHRTTATLGGNLCLDTRCVFYNQSTWWRQGNDFCLKYAGTVCHVAPTGQRCHAAYSGDLAPVLMALEAKVEVAGPEGLRSVDLGDLFQEDGAAHLRLADDEMLVAAHIPIRPGLRVEYEKARYRGAIDFPLAGVAVALACDGQDLETLRIAVTGASSRPFLLDGCAPLLGKPLDEAALKLIEKLVQQQVSPMRTTIVPAHYRRRVAAALARRLTDRLYREASSAEAAGPT